MNMQNVTDWRPDGTRVRAFAANNSVFSGLAIEAVVASFRPKADE
jgi:hypothetical protein